MFVIKRDGNRENVRFDKITNRLQKLIDFEDIDPVLITQKLSSMIKPGITTTELDILASQICMSMVMEHPNFGILAAKIAISNHQKNTKESILNVAKELYNNVDENNEKCSLISDELYEIVCKDYKIIDDMIDMERDFLLDFFGFKTLEKSYLLKIGAKNKKIVERPQHLFMRVALGIYGNDFENVKKLYDNLSLKNYTHATPTLFNSGTKYPQLSSCFEKNTLVNTLKGPIPIKDICIGDEVITHLGNVKKVVQIHKNPINNRKLYEVEIVKTNKFIVTEDHKLRIYNKKTNDIEWKPVNKLEQTDYVMIPKYSGCIDEHEIDCLNILNNYKFDDNTILCNNLNDINILSSKELLSLLKEKGIKGCDKLSKENLIKKLKADKIETQFIQYSLNENKLINTYNSLNEASLKTNISKRQILAASSNGKSKKNSAGGFIWERKNKKIPYEEPKINDKFIFTMTNVTNNNINKEVTCYIKSIPIFRKIIVNKDYSKFLGIWYGDGHIITKKNKICGIGITIHKDNKNLIDFCINMKEHFGLKNVYIHKMNKQNIIQVLYNSTPLGILFYSLYGKGFNGKKLNKDIYKYSNDLLLSFISGLITSDGWVTKTGTIGLQLSNKILIQEIYSLLRMNNIPVSGLRKIQMNKYSHTQGYSLQLTCLKNNLTDIWKTYEDCIIDKLKIKQKTNNENTCINFDSFNFLKFKNKKEVSIEDDFVYTLGVEDDHSYSIEGIIAQNCYLIGTEDSVEGIFETITDCAKISKWSGGIGVHISNIRANGSYIRKTAGHSDGILPMLKVYNDTARYINQCILPDVKVYSKFGIKRIDMVTLDDKLLTSDGTYRKVNQIFINNKNEDTLEIFTKSSLIPLKCTKNHEIFRIQPKLPKTAYKTLKRQLEIGSIKREFVNSDEIKVNDYLGFPIPTYEKDIDNWSLDICRLYGLILGDGNITFSQTSARYQVTLNNTTKQLSKIFIIDLLNKLDIHYWISNECEICWTYNSNSISKIKIKQEDIYDDNMEKRCLPEVLHLPYKKLAMVIKGMLESDGCLTDTGIYFVNTSLNLIESITFMLLRFKILTTVQIIDKVGEVMSKNKKGIDIVARKIAYNLRIPQVDTLKTYNIFDNYTIKSQKSYFEYDGILYSRVVSINEKKYNGKVYDFNMEDNHNYLTTSGLVHNSGKRNGSFAVYLEPWHADVYDFIDAKKNVGSDEIRARDLFYALWVPDLFMETVEKDGDWHLMCPNVCPGLPDVYGEKFNDLYNKYISEGKYVKKIKARDLWKAIISAQVELGIPYIGYKDHVNKKNNQSNIGTIKSSNLCIEINEVSDNTETAVCLTSDTIIFTDEGLKKIIDCDDTNVLSFYNNDKDLLKEQKYIKAKLINNGIKEVFEIDLVGGFPIKATKNHKFLVLKDRGYNNKVNTYEWKTVEELTLKDRINRPKIEPLPIFKNVDIIKDLDIESLIVGWMIGDGLQRSYNGVCFGSHEIYYQLNKIQSNLKYGKNKKVQTYISKNGVQWACTFINNYGLEPKLGKNKIISDKINKLEPFKIASILSGLFSADGTVYRKIDKFYIGLSSASKQLLIDVQLLLKCFGITSCLKTFQGKLTIENKESILLFSKYINFLLCPEKKQKLEDGILNHVYSREIDEREWMSIRSIKNVGFENVYDLNIPNSHNFIANMVTVHNCNLASICLPSIIKKPNAIDDIQNSQWKSLLSKDEKDIVKRIFDGKLKLFSTSDCTYCKLLKTLLKDTNLEYEEIDDNQAEKYRILSEPSLSVIKPFETVPQLFTIYDGNIYHIGGYDDTWAILKPRISHTKIYDLSYELIRNLNKIIDKNFYPTEKTNISNMRHRPVGLGVQGLADVFLALKLPFDSENARKINIEIFETMYFGAMSSSCDSAKEEGIYSTFKGSHLSNGKFQFNLWGLKDEDLSGKWNWSELREKIQTNGVRNSLLIALMPTASTSQIMGSYVEAFEPLTSNLYNRRTLAGEFTVINPYLIKDLISLELWNDDIKNRLQYDKGSVQNIKGLPKFLKDIYRTAYEIPQRSVITMSAERAPFVCQSQSLNLFFDKPDFKKLTGAHFLGWKLGLKTGSYYIRSKPAMSSQRFGMDINKEKELQEEDSKECLTCSA